MMKFFVVTLLSLLSFLSSNMADAQSACSYLPGIECANVDYNNYGANSNTNAASIEYDNYVSTFHSSVLREYSGDFRIWGEKTSPNAGNLNVPAYITIKNYPALTGKLLKASMGSNSTFSASAVICKQAFEV